MSTLEAWRLSQRLSEISQLFVALKRQTRKREASLEKKRATWTSILNIPAWSPFMKTDPFHLFLIKVHTPPLTHRGRGRITHVTLTNQWTTSIGEQDPTWRRQKSIDSPAAVVNAVTWLAAKPVAGKKCYRHRTPSIHTTVFHQSVTHVLLVVFGIFR